jgi:Cfr10I/Bse634I restriction endonuclease
VPFNFDSATICPNCPLGFCFEDRRANPVRGRTTQFRFKQGVAMRCTFGDFLPGSDNDPDPGRTYDEYFARFRANALAAGAILFRDAFGMNSAAIAKVEGDVFELLEAGVLWNAVAAWNRYMDGGAWDSAVFGCPAEAVATPTRKVAVLKLPRGYDTTRLFKDEVRRDILAHEQALRLRGLELGLSSPDLVGVRLPHPLPAALEPFLRPMPSLDLDSLGLLESAHRLVEGLLSSGGFLFAVAVKRTTRSDRLYQPLFEANVLKYLIEYVLRGAAFRFHVHLGSLEGADAAGHYTAASLVSLMRGGTPGKAVDVLYHAVRPRDSAQEILNELPLFPM